jgi:hypothetical protein
MSRLEELESKVASGDPGARFLLAKSLLSGSEGALDPARAAELLLVSCNEGNADASELIAALEAMGAGRLQSWARALHYLVLAAEQGSQSARSQLLLLANDNDGSVGNASDWNVLGQAIDVDRLTSAPERRSLCEDPRIRVLDGFATPAECRWLIARARGRLGPAMVFNRVTGDFARDAGRSNSAIELPTVDMDVVTEIVRSRIGKATNLPVPVFEPPHILHYSVGQEFKPHFDFLDPANQAYAALLDEFGQRIATFLIYLNDDYEGGETEFPTIGLSHKGRAGDALLFANVDRSNRPDAKTLHAGRAPTSGEKWIFSQWIRDRAPGVLPPGKGA